MSYNPNEFLDIAQFSEAGQEEATQKRPPTGGLDFLNSKIDPKAFKKDSALRTDKSVRWNPATDNTTTDVLKKASQVGKGKKDNKKDGKTDGLTSVINRFGGSAGGKLDDADEKKRVALIDRYNDYLDSPIIYNRLVKAGWKGAFMPANASLPQVELAMANVNKALSKSAARNAMTMVMAGANQVAEHFLPDLRKQNERDFGLNEFYQTQKDDPESDIALSFEELCIHAKPWVPATNFALRFAESYTNFILQLRNDKIARRSSIQRNDVVPSREEIERMMMPSEDPNSQYA